MGRCRTSCVHESDRSHHAPKLHCVAAALSLARRRKLRVVCRASKILDRCQPRERPSHADAVRRADFSPAYAAPGCLEVSQRRLNAFQSVAEPIYALLIQRSLMPSAQISLDQPSRDIAVRQKMDVNVRNSQQVGLCSLLMVPEAMTQHAGLSDVEWQNATTLVTSCKNVVRGRLPLQSHLYWKNGVHVPAKTSALPPM